MGGDRQIECSVDNASDGNASTAAAHLALILVREEALSESGDSVAQRNPRAVVVVAAGDGDGVSDAGEASDDESVFHDVMRLPVNGDDNVVALRRREMAGAGARMAATSPFPIRTGVVLRLHDLIWCKRYLAVFDWRNPTVVMLFPVIILGLLFIFIAESAFRTASVKPRH